VQHATLKKAQSTKICPETDLFLSFAPKNRKIGAVLREIKVDVTGYGA